MAPRLKQGREHVEHQDLQVENKPYATLQGPLNINMAPS